MTYSLQSSTGYWVTLLARALEADLDERFQAHGVTRGSWAVLSAIAHHDKTTPAELTAFIGIDGAAITRQLDRIVKQGLVTRRRGTKDRRVVHLILTEKGAALVPKIAAESQATNAKFQHGLELSEIEALREIIRKMLGNGDVAPGDF